VKHTEKQPCCKKRAAFKSLGKRSSEINGGSQEMAAIILSIKKMLLQLGSF